MDSKLEKLIEHEFSKAVLENANKVNLKHSSSKELLKADPNDRKEVPSLDFYLVESGTRLAHLISLYEQLTHIPAYLKKYKRTSSMASKKITRMHYTQYHLENFIVKSKSFEDRALQFSASIAYTGISRKDINFTQVTRNTHIETTEIKKALSAIHNLCGEYAGERNEIIHQRNLFDEDLREVEFMLLVSRQDEESKKFAQAEYRRLIQKFAKEKVPEIVEFNKELYNKTVDLFDSLQPYYKLWINRLK